MNRREFLAALSAGAVVTAEGLWMPGRKLISIPRAPLFGTSIMQHPTVRAAQEAYNSHIVDALRYGMAAVRVERAKVAAMGDGLDAELRPLRFERVPFERMVQPGVRASNRRI